MNERLIELFSDLAIYEDYLAATSDKSRQFAAKAYRQGVEIIKSLDYEITPENAKKLSDIRGIGKAIRDKTVEFLETGHVKRHDEFLQSPAAKMKEMAQVKNIGMKKAKALFDAGITSAEALKQKAAETPVGKELAPGLKMTAAIKASIENDLHSATNRMKINEHNDVAGAVIDALKDLYGVKDIATAGSARRYDGGADYTIGDIDIVVGTDGSNDDFIRDRAEDALDQVALSGPTKISGSKNGRQVDIRIVPAADFGATMLHATGSAEFNKECRRLAIAKGWKLNEYGLFDENGICISKDEHEILDKIGLGWVEPRDRTKTFKANI